MINISSQKGIVLNYPFLAWNIIDLESLLSYENNECKFAFLHFKGWNFKRKVEEVYYFLYYPKLYQKKVIPLC